MFLPSDTLAHAFTGSAMSDVTQILNALQRGEHQSTDELLPLVYAELRKLASARLAHEAPGQTIQATELVHEAYLRLVGLSSGQNWEGRRHFFAAAAEAMRRILIDRARRKQRLKHGGHLDRVDFEEIEVPSAPPNDELLAVDDALAELARVDAPAAELVKLRFFVGLTQAQAAEIVGVSTRTADNIWAFARAWLYKAIRRQ
jgi:RNA polymerase sigma factor (TIGR02999 family)